jgi:hypothetical protein
MAAPVFEMGRFAASRDIRLQEIEDFHAMLANE